MPRMPLPRETFGVVRNLRRVLVMILVAPVLALAEEAKPPSAHFHGSVGAPLPNVKLPPAIPADDGKLTIYADFGKAKDGKVPLYLVNRTAEPKVFSSQDLDIFLKLERRMSDGRWERVQVHQDSWCGNSHYPVELPPGNHFAFSGYLPTAGSKAQVRFRSYGSSPLVSNEGEGFFLEEDRLAAGLDQMALRELPDSLQAYFRFDPDEIDGWQLGQVVAFVGGWKRKEDVSLFRSLLGHPAYQRSEGARSLRPGVRLEFRRYRVREEARQILIGMGESVPKDVILEEERVIP